MAHRRFPNACGASAASAGKKSVVTKVAGFAFPPSESVIRLMAAFESSLPESVITEVAGFANEFGPQLPGVRIRIPAHLR